MVVRYAARCLLMAAVFPGAGVAQRPTLDWGAQAIPTLTQTNVVPGNRTLGEVRIVQPVAMLHAAALDDHLRLMATADFEKWTITHGELAPGDWGESFADRRHPHTVVHEVMLAAGFANAFVALGKGFAPFGTDDPMSRPVVRFPVNHHLSQILERAVAIAGLRAGPAMLEGGLFNGEEPVSPGSWPLAHRFADSWAGRFTLRPLDGLEAQVSHAFVNSPENRAGAGLDDAKWSASARWESRRLYALIEWARTSVGRGVFIYRSVLAEGAVSGGWHRAYLRFERTERPEEERKFESLFRTVRPVFENSILGVTRWTIVTVGDAFEITRDRLRLAPFAELSSVGIAKVGGGVFDPFPFYGRERGFTASVGMRFGAGMRMPRMGRYVTDRRTMMMDHEH